MGAYDPVVGPQNAYNPAQAVQTLSDLVNLQRNKQALQTGAYQQQSAQADAQNAQQQMRERQWLANAMRSGKDEFGNSILNGDGEPDTKKVISAVSRNMPLLGQNVIQSIQKTQSDRAALDDSIRGLGQNYKNDLAGIARSFIGRDAKGSEITAALEEYGKRNPDAMPTIHWASNLLDNFDHVPQDKRGPALLRFAQELQPSSATAAEQTSRPSAVQGRQGLNLVETNPLSPYGAGTQLNQQPIGQGVAPTGGLVSDAYGRQFRYNQQTNRLEPLGTGAIGTPTGAAGSGGASGGQPGGFVQPVAGQDQVLKEVGTARTAGDQVGAASAVNGRILQELKKTTTGPYTEFGHNLAAAAGLPGGQSYQEVSAFLDRQAAMAANTMGLPNTNAGLETSKSLTGNTQYDNKVIEDKTTFAEGMNQAAGAYRQALDRAIGTGPTPNLANYQAFRSQWARNFDPTIFEYENAVRTGDTQRRDEIEKAEGTRGMRALMQKRRALQDLVHGPQQ